LGGSADSGQKLIVNGTSKITQSLIIGTVNSSDSNLYVESGNARIFNALRINKNGSFFAASSSRGILEVDGTTDAIFALTANNTTRSYLYYSTSITQFITDTNYQIAVGGANTIYSFAATQNVYIGTGNTPTDNGNKLQVNGNQSLNGGLRFYDFIGATSNYWDVYQYNDGTFRYNYNGAGNDELIIYNNGDIRASGAGKFGSAGNNAKLEVAASTGEVFRADAASGAYRIVADQTKVNLSSIVNINSIPTSSAGLSSGDIWSNAGVLNIVP